jgi:hypothetical protein
MASSKLVRLVALSTVLSLGVGLSGCNNNSSITASDDPDHNVSISFKAESGTVNRVTSNTLVIESAKILLKNVKFKHVSSHDSNDVKVGPLVVNLNLSGSINEVMVARVPAAAYDRIKFRVHKPEDFEPIPDQEFREGLSGDQRYSLIVGGTFNDRSFVYKSRQNADQEIRLLSPITVSDNGVVNVTLVVDPYEWFRENDDYLNPAVPNNSGNIDDAIKNSFARAFKDNDRNGEPD